MAETYCGKACGACAQKELLHCPGCKSGPGRIYGGDCELAKCVRTKGHETCSTCTLKGQCGNLRNCQYFPEYRRRKLEAEKLTRETLERRVPLFGKWLWILFWLVIPSSIAGLLANETLGQSIPSVYLVGQILKALCSVAYGLILLKLGSEESSYRTAGICVLISGVLGALLSILPVSSEKPFVSLLLLLPVMIVSMVGEYNEYMGHSAVLYHPDQALSEKWQVLWKWFIGLYLGMFGSIFVLLLNPALGAFSLLGAVVGILVISILKLVNLYRTAKLFREFPMGSEEETVY